MVGRIDRRRFLVGTSGVVAAFAGCTGGDDEQSAQSGPEKRYESLEEFPDQDELLETHAEVLHELEFVAVERSKQTSSESSDSEGRDRTIRRGDAGTLITGDDVARRYDNADQKKQAWIAEHARTTRYTNSYYPDETPKPYIESSTISNIIQLGVFERTDVTDNDERVFVFEATEVDSENGDLDDVEVETFDVRVEITETGYIRSFDAELTVASASDKDRTQTFSYEYQVSDVGDVSVSKPEFVDDALRIEAELSEDGSVLVLQHAGGPALPAGTEITLQDKEAMPRERPTVPAEFGPGDEAYVYWESDTVATIAVEDEPSEVAREWARATDDRDRNIYLEGSPDESGQRFEIRFTHQA